MSFQLKLNLICLLCLLIQVQAQDIPVEFPVDFPTTTVETVTELAETTTTTAAATEPAPTTTTTTETTTTDATTAATTLPTNNMPAYPTYAPPTYVPHYPIRPTSAPQFPWLWNPNDSDSEMNCYLKEQVENKYVSWTCGFNSWRPTKSCYRCCYYSYSSYAGCTKLHEGRCNNGNWAI
ncbi:mucin-2 [Drosophila hydei]|uniref:Mucin-2 n=1 Tax=Drosophila hydei TaxID=7224 RepID=A0A6J1MRN1_DROHY|nr:mucin-2 [Drosophila hydei]